MEVNSFLENYWLNKLKDAEQLEWPYTLSVPAPAVTTLTVPVEQETMAAIRGISGNSDLNILKLMIGGLGILLWKYTRQENIVIALPPLSLPDTDIDKSGALYCILKLDHSLPVKNLLDQVHTSLNDAHLHSEYDEAVLKADFSTAKNGNMLSMSSVGLNCSGVNMEGNWLNDHQLLFDFVIGSPHLKITARYLPVPPDMLQNMAESLLHIVSNFALNKEKSISQCTIVTDKEIRLWNTQFQNKRREYPTEITVIDLFLQQVKKKPAHTALVFGDDSLTYKALSEWSEKIAGYISSCTVSNEQLFIGVMVSRSPALIATILGVLRAGAAYVPIDLTYPAERISEIATDANCPLIFTDSDNIPLLQIDGCSLVNVFAIPSVEEQSLPLTHPGSVAYVIYSSGTTGKPKGIMIQHRAILNLLYWYNERYTINDHTRIVQLTNVVIDIAFQEIFSALINGLTLYIPKQEEQQDKWLFLEWLNKHQISFIQLIPDLLSTYFLDTPKVESIEYMLCGGDKLNERLKDEILSKGYRLYNIYGQTETAIDTVGAECSYNVPMCFNDYVPNYEVIILDEYENFCPEYLAGEICTSGAGLALGYLNNPIGTAQKFVAHPFEEGKWLYRTGDRARRMPDGSIRLLGRGDEQVKIRGYRIELEEIEEVLSHYPGIEGVAVIVRVADDEDKRLAAFLVSSKSLNIQECITYIKQKLPVYMLPDYFLQIDKLPLTANGKIDRKALSRHELIPVPTDKEYVAPRNETEAALVLIWEEILGRNGIGVNDNFFELGGHSLKATRLLSRIRKVLGVVIGLKELFLHPVLEVQAVLIAGAKKDVLAGIPVLAVSDSYELSSSQYRLWILSQFEESNVAYNIPGVTVFEGSLDYDALSAAFTAVISRHEILRTIFMIDDAGIIQQYILSESTLGFKIDDKDLRPLANRDEVLANLIRTDFHSGFDLSKGPLLRACLYQVSDHKWVFSYVMHHIISDAWSMGVFFNDLLKYYNGFAAGEKLLLPPLRIQYKDYSGWQRGQLDSISSHKDYWLDQFSGELPVLELPVDKVRPAVKSYNGGLVKHSFPSGLSDRLQKFVRNEGCTLFMGLLSVVNVLLYRFTGQEDLITGSPVAGREDSDLDEQIGFYVNTLALRTRFSGGESFRSLLQIVKGVTLGAYAHQVYPFDALVTDLGLQHNPGRSALFDVMISLQNAGNDEITSALPAGLRLSRYGHVEHVSSKFDLLFNFQEFDDGLHAGIEYNSDLFEQDTILRMADHLEHLLSAVLMAPDSPLYSLSYLGTAERGLLLEGFNATADAGHPSDQTLVSLFEEQVRQTPGHIALVSGKLRLTYRELNACANQLGHYLRENYAIKRDDLVALRVDRNEWMIIAILGVLKAGGAYVPVDPQYPQERLDYMLSDSGSRFLMDEHALEQFRGQMHLYSKEDPFPVNVASDLAYVIYTSGTTGQPKGTLISHYQVVRLFKTDTPLFDFGSSDIWTMFHSYCFDFSVWEMYGALLFGGQLVMVPLMVARDPGAYLELLIDEQVSVLNQTPSSFYNLIRADEERGVPGLKLRYVIFGGEALSPIRLQHWHVRYPWVRLINMYGITETTVHVTYKEIGEKEILNNISNIGKAIPTLRTYVLDGYQQLVPIGVWGELYVGGAGVGRGYLNREVLTRERFIDSWFKEGERLYRSGDRVRVLANGEMEYDGRLDEQVKIRGYRIELGEIESALEKHNAINRAVVIARAGKREVKELIAYVVYENNGTIETDNLRGWLSTYLPEYMLPSYFIRLDEMPLTANGKIDRKKLPDFDISRQIKINYTPPENKIQQLLADIWQQVLGLEKVGIHDNFFSIGGNSISMIEVISKARKHQLTITIRQMFEHPAIAALSQVVVIKKQDSADQSPVTGSMVLLPVQQWYFEKQHKGTAHFNYAIIRSSSISFNKEMLFAMVSILIKKHDVLRLRFPKVYDGTAVYEPFSENMISAVAETVNYSHIDPAERITLVSEHAAEMQKSLSLHDGPLWKIVWYDYGSESKGRLLLIIHHLLVDGVSWRLLINEFNQLLVQMSENQPFSLDSKTSAYKEWSEKLLLYSKSDELLKQQTYWCNVVKGAGTCFPFDVKNPQRTVADQQQVVLELSEAYSEKMIYHALKAYNIQVKDLLLTALQMSVCRWGKISNFLVHLEGHGREDLFEHIDLSQTMGWFTSIYPVLLRESDTDPETNDQIGKAIKSIKENLRAIPDNGIGYGILRYFNKDEAIQSEEHQNPASVLFNYLGDFRQTSKDIPAEQILEKVGETISKEQNALYPLEFNGAIINKRLRFVISYDQVEYESFKIKQLAEDFKDVLENIIDHCIQIDRTHFTPSDFPLAGLGQARIEELEEEFPAMNELYPATSMQKSMFFHSLIAEDDGAYVVLQHGHLKNIDPAIFALSWQYLIERHSVLRTAFVMCETNGVLQVVSKQAEVPSTFIDCHTLDKKAWEKQIAATVESEAYINFDFERAPLFRYTILQLNSEISYVTLAVHHIILDGWSMPVLYAELSQIYSMLSDHEPVKLPSVPDYGKYMGWLLTQNQLEAMTFWKQKFKNSGEISQLALLENAVPEISATGYRELTTQFTVDESDLLKSAAAKYKVTLHTLLVAAWARLLSDYTQSNEVIFGMTISGRNEEFEGIGSMVGMFINSVPVKVESNADQQTEEWLSVLHKQQMEYNQYGLLGLNDIRQLSGFDPNVPMFESLLVHQNYPDHLKTGQGNDGALFEFSNAGFKDENNYPLTLMIFSKKQLSFLITYKTEFFGHGFIERVAESYKKHLNALAQEIEIWSEHTIG